MSEWTLVHHKRVTTRRMVPPEWRVEAAGRARPEWPADKWVVVFGWPEDNDPRCRAVTRRGTRCRRPIFYSQSSAHPAGDEIVTVTKADLERLQAGLCAIHRRAWGVS